MHQLRACVQGLSEGPSRGGPCDEQLAPPTCRWKHRHDRLAARATAAHWLERADAGERDLTRRRRVEDAWLDPRARDLLPGSRGSGPAAGSARTLSAIVGSSRSELEGFQFASGEASAAADAAGGDAGGSGRDCRSDGIGDWVSARANCRASCRVGAGTGVRADAGGGVRCGAHRRGCVVRVPLCVGFGYCTSALALGCV